MYKVLKRLGKYCAKLSFKYVKWREYEKTEKNCQKDLDIFVCLGSVHISDKSYDLITPAVNEK